MQQPMLGIAACTNISCCEGPPRSPSGPCLGPETVVQV
jgi:hypothetical protein